MNYIVYVTINRKTDYVFFGITTNEDKNYLGDNVWRLLASTYMYPKTPFLLAVKKDGHISFYRIDLFKYSNLEDAIAKLNLLVDRHQLNVYNPIKESKYTYIPIYQFDLNGKLIKKWQTCLDACGFYNTSVKKFEFAIKDKHTLAKSLWSTKDSIDITLYNTGHWNNALTTYLYGRNGKLIDEFMTPQDLAEYLNVGINVVKDSIKNQHSIDNKYYATNKLVIEYTPKARRLYAKCPIYIYDSNCQLIKTIKGKELLRFLKQHSWQKIKKICDTTGGWYEDYYLSFTKEPPMKRYFKIYNEVGDLIETTDEKDILINNYGLTKAQVERVIRGQKHQNNYVINYCK